MACAAASGSLPVHVITCTDEMARWGSHMDKGRTAVPCGLGIQGKHSKDLAPFLGGCLLNIFTHGKPSTSYQLSAPASTSTGSWPEPCSVCVRLRLYSRPSASPQLGLVTLKTLALQITVLKLDTGEKHSLPKVCKTSPGSSRMGL